MGKLSIENVLQLICRCFSILLWNIKVHIILKAIINKIHQKLKENCVIFVLWNEIELWYLTDEKNTIDSSMSSPDSSAAILLRDFNSNEECAEKKR